MPVVISLEWDALSSAPSFQWGSLHGLHPLATLQGGSLSCCPATPSLYPAVSFQFLFLLLRETSRWINKFTVASGDTWKKRSQPPPPAGTQYLGVILGCLAWLGGGGGCEVGGSFCNNLPQADNSSLSSPSTLAERTDPKEMGWPGSRPGLAAL